MARGRMIDKKLMTSRKVNSVSLGAECLYIRIILLTDDFGRYYADPRILKAHAFPMRSATERSILKWLEELVDMGLIRTYSDHDEDYLEVAKFEDFQTFRADRKRQRIFPVPSRGYQCHTSAMPVGDCSSREGKVTKGKGIKEKENVIRYCDDPKCQNLDHWECQFKHYWEAFPKSMGRTDTHSLFLSICRKGEIGKLIKALDGYIEYLNDQRINENFDQAPMNSARFLRKDNWREFIGFKMRKKL